MRTKRAKKGRERNARLAVASALEAAAAKLVEQQEVAAEMRFDTGKTWERYFYETEYLCWWERWDCKERFEPMLDRKCLDDGFDPGNPLDVLVYGYLS